MSDLKELKEVTINFLGKKKKLKLITGEYLDNDKIYYGLIDKRGESFCDITVNIDESNLNYIDYDFMSLVFKGNRIELRKRLKQNLDIKDFGLAYTRGCYYFTL